MTRSNVTAASRIMLPAYVAMFTVLGLNYTLTPRSRLTESPALHYAAHILPLPAWGCMFLAVAMIQATALLIHERTAYRFALWVAALAMGVWAVVFVLAAALTETSPTAAAWPAFVATACMATERSLLKGERN